METFSQARCLPPDVGSARQVDWVVLEEQCFVGGMTFSYDVQSGVQHCRRISSAVVTGTRAELCYDQTASRDTDDDCSWRIERRRELEGEAFLPLDYFDLYRTPSGVLIVREARSAFGAELVIYPTDALPDDVPVFG